MLLASSPEEFEKCGSAIVSTPTDADPSHYSITNKGLQTEMGISGFREIPRNIPGSAQLYFG